MKKYTVLKKGIYFVTIISLMFFVIHIFPINKKYNKEEIDEVKLLNNNQVKNQEFAIMVQGANGEYQETTQYPTGNYEINTSKSGCMDMNGNKVDAEISYNKANGSIGINTSVSANCYFYFDKETFRGGNALALWNTANDNGDEVGLGTSGLTGDGKRYFGENPDNYICFGTSDSTTCKNTPGTYMYRIIGVFDKSGTKYLKLIKKEALDTKMAWHSTDEEKAWKSNTLYSAINGASYLTNNDYLGNKMYNSSEKWSDLITSWTWRATNTKTYESSGADYNHTSPKGIYQNEMFKTAAEGYTCGKSSDSDATVDRCGVGVTATVSAKIGLMYASDYALSLGSTATSMTTGTGTNESILKTGWMHLSNNDSEAPSAYEWTISRYGKNLFGYNRAFYVYLDGDVANDTVTNAYSVRPAFYLNSDVVITNGQGTLSDPYIIG